MSNVDSERRYTQPGTTGRRKGRESHSRGPNGEQGQTIIPERESGWMTAWKKGLRPDNNQGNNNDRG